MFERFTDRARRVVVLAQEEARISNHDYIGTEHFLLGLIHEEDGIAARVLGSLGVSMEAARMRIERLVGRGEAIPTDEMPFTPRAKKVLELSLREALQLNHNYIGTEHVLLGLIREGEGVGCQVLVELGADLNDVRQRVIQVIQEGGIPPERVSEGEHVMESLSAGSLQSARATLGVDPATMPLCPVCHTSMAGNLRSRFVEAFDDEGIPEARLLVVYCTRCGVAIETRIEDAP
jgi:ATP-dependent Clp protease ATP-binding subunit ClpC